MNAKRSVAFHNLGCKVNSYETEAMLACLLKEGYEQVPFTEAADVYVINTCSVTNIADRKSRQMLHRARALNPAAVIVATGCYAQAQGEKLLEDGAVDIVLGNDRKSLLPEVLKQRFESGEKLAAVTDIGACRSFEEMPADYSEHTRAFLKIEDGCNQFCSYCLIPYVRGRVRSRAREDILNEAKRLIDRGFRELVLTGIHLSSYGIDRHGDAGLTEEYGAPLLSLMEEMDRLPGLSRIRLGSLEPRIVTPAIVGRLKNIESFCPHFHLSLQSGCDATLKRMNRKYSSEEFYEKMCFLRESFDRPALTTDVIVGFPGETEEEFEASRAFLEKAAFYETHIFKYSRRAGTVADRLPGQLTEAVKAARSDVLEALNAVNRSAYCRSFLGEKREVLLEVKEKKNGKELWTGYTREYVRLGTEARGANSGQLLTVSVDEASLLGL